MLYYIDFLFCVSYSRGEGRMFAVTPSLSPLLLPMEFDWIDCHFDLKKITPREVEEAFEDPFSIRLLPESGFYETETRFFLLGKTLNARLLFSVFWTDGKNYRVIFCREMEEHEEAFYERKNAEWV